MICRSSGPVMSAASELIGSIVRPCADTLPPIRNRLNISIGQPVLRGLASHQHTATVGFGGPAPSGAAMPSLTRNVSGSWSERWVRNLSHKSAERSLICAVATGCSSNRISRVWLRCWNRRARNSGDMMRLESPTRCRYPLGLRCTKRLRGISNLTTSIMPLSRRVGRSVYDKLLTDGSIESMQISLMRSTTTSRRFLGMPTISRDLSSTPNTNTPPLLFANAAISSAISSCEGPETLLPEKRTSLSSR